MNHCKHIIQTSGLFCQHNAVTEQGYCRQHLESRMKLSVTDEFSFTTTTICQQLCRGKQKFCKNPSVEGLINNMCQTCYDKAKEKRKAVIIKDKQTYEQLKESHISTNLIRNYNSVLTKYRDDIAETWKLVVFESLIEDLYYDPINGNLTLEEKRNIIHQIETDLYPTHRNITPNHADVVTLQEWCEDEDNHIFLDRPFVRFTVNPPAPPTLRQLARDSQNVHTTEVVQQSNKIIEKLLELSLKDPKLQRVPDFLAAKWLLKKYGSWSKVKPIAEDMIVWYNTSFCKKENDWLYKKILDGLYIYLDGIKDRGLRNEIYFRIFQECKDSVGMCCEGHIARLANVLVGFDEEAKPQVSTGELLQQKMAAIAMMEGISDVNKQEMARKVFAELNIPDSQQQAWLDAF